MSDLRSPGWNRGGRVISGWKRQRFSGSPDAGMKGIGAREAIGTARWGAGGVTGVVAVGSVEFVHPRGEKAVSAVVLIGALVSPHVGLSVYRESVILVETSERKWSFPGVF